MTPVQWNRAIAASDWQHEEEAKQGLVSAWLNAKFVGTKGLPTLESLLAPPVEVVELTPEEVERQRKMVEELSDRVKRWKAKKGK
jgi:hypothetical protein